MAEMRALGLAARHFQNNRAPTFDIAQLGRVDRGHAATIKIVAHLNLAVAAIAHADQRAAACGFAVNPNQVHLAQVQHISHRGLARDGV